MYFTESPHLQSIEAIMKTVPRYPQAQESEQKEGINMVSMTFTHFTMSFARNI